MKEIPFDNPAVCIYVCTCFASDLPPLPPPQASNPWCAKCDNNSRNKLLSSTQTSSCSLTPHQVLPKPQCLTLTPVHTFSSPSCYHSIFQATLLRRQNKTPSVCGCWSFWPHFHCIHPFPFVLNFSHPPYCWLQMFYVHLSACPALLNLTKTGGKRESRWWMIEGKNCSQQVQNAARVVRDCFHLLPGKIKDMLVCEGYML